MITNVRTVTVPVRDQAAALAFYSEKLGFEIRADQPMGADARWIEVAPPGGRTALVLYTPPGMAERIGTFTGVVLACDDAERTYTELSARGVAFTARPTAQPWGGIMGQLEDQDGNGFVLVQSE